tara:strand:+ start:4403 stop:6025 length:1623 start_codon:yes stop_codon:yes gene_type:complete
MKNNFPQDKNNLIEESLVAGIDLGSNTFKLMIAKIRKNGDAFKIQELDTVKSTVRLAAGLDKENILSEEIIDKALNCLLRFGDRVRNFPKNNVCIIATNTFRKAQNAKTLIIQGEKLLGFPINVLSGAEEARLVFKGSSHVSPVCSGERMVIDLGGSSTEIVLGFEDKVNKYDSLQMGCVTSTKQFFQDGNITKKNFSNAIDNAKKIIEKGNLNYKKLSWHQVIGSSGTARAVADLISLNHFDDINKLPINDLGGIITLKGLYKIKEHILAFSNCSKIKLLGLKNERRPVLAGGLSILIAIFEIFKIKQMEVSESAIIFGALHQALISNLQEKNKDYKAIHKQIIKKEDFVSTIDRRAQEVNDWSEQFTIDQEQASRLSKLSINIYKKININRNKEYYNSKKLLDWACRLHEIGLVINYRQYQYHSSYIISHKELTAFSSNDQARLASLVLGHKSRLDKLNFKKDYIDWPLLLSLRISFIIYKKRKNFDLPEIKIENKSNKITVIIDKNWLDKKPFTKFGILKEAASWKKFFTQYELIAR